MMKRSVGDRWIFYWNAFDAVSIAIGRLNKLFQIATKSETFHYDTNLFTLCLHRIGFRFFCECLRVVADNAHDSSTEHQAVHGRWSKRGGQGGAIGHGRTARDNATGMGHSVGYRCLRYVVSIVSFGVKQGVFDRQNAKFDRKFDGMSPGKMNRTAEKVPWHWNKCHYYRWE